MNARFALWCVLMSALLATTASAQNPIQLENAKQGTSAWQLTQPASNHQIEGYASLTSVDRGGQIQFFVNTIDPTFSIQIFRMGWYGGAGGRLITTISAIHGTAQPACPSDPTTMLMDCAWTDSYTLQIPDDTSDPTDWCSGVYLAKLTSSSGWQSYIVFDVRDDARSSAYLFQNSVNTHEAYNNWGGKSLYAYSSTDSNPARKVSFNRPYADWNGASQFMSWEYPMVRFLEGEAGQAYDVTYATDVDIDGNASLLLSHKADILVGHGEYWTYNIRANIQAAINQGLNLGFFSANTCYWQIRYESSLVTGAPDRTVVGYKGYALTEDPDYIDGNTSLYPFVTTNWRSAPVNRPEDALIGVLYANEVSTSDIVVYNASNWVFQNTGLQNGSHIVNVLGDEADGLGGATPPGTVLLSHSPYTIPSSTTTYYADMTVYTASSGATVFAAGSITWSWGLDNWASAQASPPVSAVSAAAQQLTRNVLAHFVGTSSTPTITVSPGTLAFGSESTGSTSSPQTVTVTNQASAALKITAAPAISGTNAADFAIASGTSCTKGAVVPANGSCAIDITFTPSLTSRESATLTLTDSDATSPQTVALTGTGTAPAAPATSFAPNSLTFASQPKGTTSGARTITLTNTGNATLSISSVTITGSNANEFAKTNVTCETSLAANTSCAISVDFAPNATGTQTATISVADNAPFSPQSITLTGTGGATAAPAVGLAPTSLTFATPQAVSTTSATQTITLTNTGNATLSISGITVSGADAKEFSIGTSTCGQSLAAGANCAIPVRFTPAAAGSRTAALTIGDNTTSGTQTVALSGTGSDFTLSSANNTSQAISAGQTATYNVEISPVAFTGAVALTCSGAPTGATCAVNPASLSLSESAPAQIVVTVATTARGSGIPGVPFDGQNMLWLFALATIALGSLGFVRIDGRRLKPSFVLMTVLLIACLGCGSTGNSTQPANANNPATSGTPSGTSSITFTATSGSTVHTLPLSLTVN